MELISIIVPVYNVEKYLYRCVESIQKQTYSNIEIILVDDGSPDHCPQMCDEMMMNDPRIKVIHKQNEGLGYARNSGLDIATGVYVTFVDSDDWISDDHIENLYQAIIKNQADVVIGSHTSVDASGIEHVHDISIEKQVYKGNDIIEQILLPLIGPDVDYPQDVQINSSCCMNLYRMEIIQVNKLRFISEKYAVAEDLYFNIDYLYVAEQLVVIDEFGYFYYENPASISRKYDKNRFQRTLHFYTQLSMQIQKYKLENQISFRVERIFLMKIRVAIRHIIVSDLSRKQKIMEIRIILEDELTQKVLAHYPIESYVPAMRVLTKMMRNRKTIIVYYLIKFREAAKKYKFLISILKCLKIGK